MNITAILAIVLLFGVLPISAIVSHVVVQAMKLKAKTSSAISPEDLQTLRSLARENAALKKRIENLEAIVTDHDMLMLRENNRHTENGTHPERYVDIELSA